MNIPTSKLDYLLWELAERGLCVLIITYDGEFLWKIEARLISWLPTGKQNT